MARKFRGFDEWVVSATAANIRKGLQTLDACRNNNPKLADAVIAWDATITSSRTKRESFAFSLRDSDGVARVYINGDAVPRHCHIWFESDADESSEFDWSIHHSGDWTGVSFSERCGTKPWDRIALRALELQGYMPDEVTFAVIVALAKK